MAVIVRGHSMRHARLCWLTVLALLGACGSGEKDLDTVCDAAGCISLKKFSAELDAQLNGKVAGYVSMIGPLPVVATYGVARTSADPPALAADTTSRINVASVSKILTTIGALQSIARHNLTLDTAISPYLPPDWTKGAGVGAVTFRELLTHSAGFQAPVNVDNPGLQQLIATDIDSTYKASCQGLGHGCYNNLNFAIFRVLLAFMEGFSDPGPALRSSVIDAFYIQYMRQNVFTPLGISTDCKPVPGSNPKLSYHFPLVAGEHGNDWGDNTSICGSTGWSLSAYELYRILLALRGGTTLLTDAQKTEMNSGCLGWDCSVQTQTDFVGKNGGLPFINPGPFGLWTFAGIFKGTVPVVVEVNSNLPDPNWNITGVVLNAFNNASVPHP